MKGATSPTTRKEDIRLRGAMSPVHISTCIVTRFPIPLYLIRKLPNELNEREGLRENMNRVENRVHRLR